MASSMPVRKWSMPWFMPQTTCPELHAPAPQTPQSTTGPISRLPAVPQVPSAPTCVARFLKMGCTGWLPRSMPISLSTPMPVPWPGPEAILAMVLEATLKRMASCRRTD